MSPELEEPLRTALAERYEVIEECGRGGTSVVYRARDRRHDRVVAIKVMRPELTSRATAERFLREIRIAGTIHHPNVARLLDSGEAGGQLYCVLEFVDGETLRARIMRQGPLPVDDAMQITRDVAAALTHAHRQGIIHRDVKPENILLAGGRAILSDFGIARAIVVAVGDRLTDSGIAVGTASYMSPEQAAGSTTLDERADQYALAVCLYEMLAGDPPFAGRTSQAILSRQMTEAPPRLEVARPSVDTGTVAAIEKALAKVPADRYASVVDFLNAIETKETKLHRVKRRPSWVVGATAGVGLAAVAAAIWTYNTRLPELDARRVMVFPARTGAADSDPEEGLRIADAIQVAVEHTDPLRWIPAWDDLDSATRADPGTLQRSRARTMSLRRGARYFVTSAVTAGGGQTSVTLLLHDAAGDTLVVQESVSDTSGAVPASALAIRALPPLLSRMLDPGQRVDLTPLTDRKLAAITRLLEGEAAYRTSRFSAAFDRYRAAVAEDSLFAYAAIKGAQAASWQNQLPDAIDLIRLARANEGLLPPKYRPFLSGVEAYLDGRGNDAVSGFKRALELDGRWVEAAMALGDTYYHLMPSEAPLDSLGQAAFGRAFALDSTFTPPLFHLAEMAIRDGNVRSARGYVGQLMRDGADPSWTRHLMLMLRCVERGMTEAEWREVAATSPDDAMLAARSLSVAGKQPACAANGFRAVLETPGVPGGTAWGAALGLKGLLMARSRGAEAVRFLDSLRVALSVPRPWAFAALAAHADSSFAPMAAEGVAFARGQFGQDYATASAKAGWVFGLFEARQGNAAAANAVSARLSQLETENPNDVTRLAAASMKARLTLLAGDTAGAVAQYLALPAVAPRDSLLWNYFEPLAPDRLTLARLLLAQGKPAEALAQASAFDHQQPVVFLAFLRPSLELRVLAAEQLGRQALANRLRARLRALDSTGRGGT